MNGPAVRKRKKNNRNVADGASALGWQLRFYATWSQNLFTEIPIHRIQNWGMRPSDYSLIS